MMEDRSVVNAKPPPMITMFFALHNVPGIPVAQRTANTHDIADFHGMQVSGHQPDFVDGEFEKALLGRRRGNTDGNFAFSGDGKLGKLARVVSKFFLVGLVQEYEFERFQVFVFGFGDDLINANRIWQVRVLHGDLPQMIT